MTHSRWTIALALMAASAACLAPGEGRRLETDDTTSYKMVDIEDPEAALDAEGDPEFYEDLAPLPLLDLDPSDLHGSVEAGFLPPSDLPITYNPAVAKWMDYFTANEGGRKFYEKSLSRASRYERTIRAILEEEGMPDDLFYLAMIESGFNPHAYSRAKASGIWQFIRATGKRYGLPSDKCVDYRCDPIMSTKAAARYLKDLHAEFGDWWLAAAGYNAGEGRVRQAKKRTGQNDYWEMVERRALPLETANYVPKLIAALIIGKDPGRYGFTDIAPQDPYEFETATLTQATDLRLIAECAGISVDEIKHLNPHLRSWHTPRIPEFDIRLPVGTAVEFANAFAAFPKEKTTAIDSHKIRSGESLGTIARKYGTNVITLQQMNGLKGTTIRAGRNLKVPASGGILVAKGSRSPEVAAREDEAPSRPKVVKGTGDMRVLKVGPGDTLWTLGRAYGATVDQLKKWNGLSSSKLRLGQKLVVYGDFANDRTAVAATEPASPGPDGGQTYTVRPGDTLSEIAIAQGVSLKQLMESNGLNDRSRIKAGQRLSLPVGVLKGKQPISLASARDGIQYTIRPGDNLWDIARAHGTTVDRLRSDNGLKRNAMLRPGDTLTINIP